jgi:hypothetical protein
MDTKILLGIPTYKFLSSFAFAHMMGTLLDGVNAGLVNHLQIEADMYVTMARNFMCKTALDLHQKGEATHILMIDDDMVVPPGSIAKLVACNVDVVGAAYYTRDLKPVAYKLHPFTFLTDTPAAGVIQVEGTGAGCLLIRCEVLIAMKEKFGDEWWFQNTIASDAGVDKYLGEDVFFFRRLKEMGVAVFLDCDIQCGHIGLAVVDRKAFEGRNVNNNI